jgi:hypothetical protein
LSPFLIALLLFFPLIAAADEVSVKFHERATMTFETPQGEVTVTAVGSTEVFKDKIEYGPNAGRLVVSGLSTRSYKPPMIFELQPDHFLVCMNCTAIAMRTFGISYAEHFDHLQDLGKAAPRDTARPAHPEFLPTFLNIVAPPRFDLIKYYGRPDLDEHFGPGVRLKSYTVEITDAPVTDSGVLERMPWICGQIGMLQPQRTDGNSEGEIWVRRALNALTKLADGDCK